MDFMGSQFTEAEKLVSTFSLSALKHFLIFFSQENKTAISSIFIFFGVPKL
jgi:hypothetical protein